MASLDRQIELLVYALVEDCQGYSEDPKKGDELMLPPAKNERHALSFVGPEPFELGTLVEVMDCRNGEWMPARVYLRWSEVDIPSGIRRFVYDVEGYDSGGNFHGRFDDAHCRRART